MSIWGRIRAFLGLCEHSWAYVTVIISPNGIEEVYSCRRCKKSKYQKRP